MAFTSSSQSRIALIAAMCGACAKLLDISPPGASTQNHEPAGAGDGGEVAGGSAGAEQGGAGVPASDRAGQGGMPGGAPSVAGGAGGRDDVSPGGAGREDPPPGGEGGRDAVASGGAGTAGESGAPHDGGEAGVPAVVFPTVGEPCSSPGKFACEEPASPGRYICEDGEWKPADSCNANLNFLCDRRTGACANAFCTGSLCNVSTSELTQCGPDEVTVTFVPCDFGCNTEQTACKQQAVNELVIDRPSNPWRETRTWPSPVIPVCFRDVVPSEHSANVREAIRFAVDTTWGRYDAMTFLDWGDCQESREGVEIELLDDCEETLAKIGRVGYPGPGEALSIGICQSYFDVTGERYPQANGAPNLKLIGYVAKHLFGHVLGLDDARHDRNFRLLMEVGLDINEFEPILFGDEELDPLDDLYGPKPSGVWFTPSGRCLGASGGVLKSAGCDGPASTRWRVTAASIVHQSSGRCLGRDGDAVTLRSCTGVEADEAFRLDRMRWQSAMNRCVTERTPGVDQSPLTLGDCQPIWPANQRFRFELLGDDRVRIHTASGACVRWPSDWNFPARPELGPCDGERDYFQARESRLEVNGRCLHNDLGEIEFRACVGIPRQRFYLSGPFEIGVSRALTLTGTLAAPELELTPLGFPPYPEQVFDYHF